MSASISASLLADSEDFAHSAVMVHGNVIAVRVPCGLSGFTLQNGSSDDVAEWAAAFRRLADRVEQAAASFDGNTDIVDNGEEVGL